MTHPSAPPPGVHTHLHPLSVHAVYPRVSSYTAKCTLVCAHPDLTPARPRLQGPLPWTPAAPTAGTTQGIGPALPMGQTLPSNCTFTLDPFPDPPQTPLGASSHASGPPQPTGLPQGALLSLHLLILLSTPVTRGGKGALRLDKFAKGPELEHHHTTSPCNSNAPPACLTALPLLPTPRKPHQSLSY